MLNSQSTEKRLKDIERLNLNARKKIEVLNKEVESKEKIISHYKQEKKEYEEKLELYSLLYLRVIDFIKNLFSKSSINTLNIHYMNLDDSFMTTLGRIIEMNPNIEAVNLEGNDITDEGLKDFGIALLNCTGNFNQINLEFNKISGKGSWEFLKTVQMRENTINKSMKKISLSYNHIEENELYIKAWESIKEIRANYPTIKTKKSDFLNASGAMLTKLFKSLCDKMIDNKEVKQLTYVLDKFEVKQDSEENLLNMSMRNKKEIYDSFKAVYENINKYKAFRSRVSRLSTKKIKLKDLEEPRDLDITLLMAQRPAFVLSYIKKRLKTDLKIDAIDKKLDETLLMYASRTNNLNLCKLLISKNASLDIKNVRIKQSEGKNAFLIACNSDNFEIADFLILNRGKLDSCDNRYLLWRGANAMHYAIKEGKVHKIMKLAEMGISLNWSDNKKKTPLHYTAKLGDSRIAELLIRLGADPNALDIKGRSPAALAEDKCKSYFVSTISSMGGRKIRMAVGKEEFKSPIDPRKE